MTALIMGVLNVTPDSFSDGGTHDAPEAAVAHARELRAQGASIIDVGGESTRPGAVPVPLDEELRRVLPVIRALSDAGITTSVDTIHAATAEAAVAAGTRFINDVSGGTHDPDMLAVAARAGEERGASTILGHWRGIPDPAHQRSDYGDVVAEVTEWLAARAEEAVRAGVDPSRLILDPGLGFDKTGAQCWELLANLDELLALGYPVLIGASRKRMLADVLEGVPEATRTGGIGPRGRDLATAVTSAFAARAGAWGVRVHDVAGTAQAIAVERAWVQGEREAPRAAAAGGLGGPSRPGDRITLRGLEAYAHHGVFEFERERGQRFVIDAELSVDLRSAAEHDELTRTVHYGELADAIVASVERDPVDLIETVAERVASLALGFAGVCTASITVHKPDAPIRAPFADVSVTVVREAAS